MKVAIIYDWLERYANNELILEEFINVFLDADVFTIVDFIETKDRGFLKHNKINTTFIQNIPKSKSKFRNYLPFMPLAIEQLDVSDYDVAISISKYFAKGIITRPGQIHISYTLPPLPYVWDLQHDYVQKMSKLRGIKGWIAKVIFHYMRIWDMCNSNNVDYYLASSQFVAKRIWKLYRRESEVIYPPIDVSSLSMNENKENFYITSTRNVPESNINIVIEAFNAMPDKRLVIIGDGAISKIIY